MNARSLPHLILALAILVLKSGAALGGDPAHPYNVRDFGAKGDKTTNDAAAIQRAIDAAAKEESGVVILPKGDYLSGRLNLASHVTLRLEDGATLYASTDPKDYQSGPHSGTLLMARGAQGVTIEGPGRVDGQATGDFGKRWGAPETADFRTHLVVCDECRDVVIRQVSFVNSDSWTIHLKRCDGVTLSQVKVHNNYRRLNSDGIDPDSCTHVQIRDCDVVSGDDAIVLKTTTAAPCADVVVADCRLESAAAALKLGTESHGDFRDIRFERCVIRNSPVGVGLYLKDGATMERIAAKDLRIELSDATFHDVVPLFIDIEKRTPETKIGSIRGVTFENIDITGGAGLLLQGMPESPLGNIVLRNITLHVRQPVDYASRKKPVGGHRTTRDDRDTLYARKPAYAALAYIHGLTVDNFAVQIAPADFQLYPRSALAGFHLQDGTVAEVTRTGQVAPPPVVDLEECEGVTVRTP